MIYTLRYGMPNLSDFGHQRPTIGIFREAGLIVMNGMALKILSESVDSNANPIFLVLGTVGKVLTLSHRFFDNEGVETSSPS